jgi:alpha-1,2-glucosyltransferase
MFVLLSYLVYLSTTNVRGELGVTFIGILALLFRQTNIFWVAVFPAGLAVVDALKKSAEHNASPGRLARCWASRCGSYSVLRRDETD